MSKSSEIAIICVFIFTFLYNWFLRLFLSTVILNIPIYFKQFATQLTLLLSKTNNYVAYSVVSLWTTRNIIKDNERTKHFFIKYISFYSRKGPTVCCKFERHILRGGTSCPISFSGSQGSQRLHPLASRIVRDVADRLPIPGSTPDSLHSV